MGLRQRNAAFRTGGARVSLVAVALIGMLTVPALVLGRIYSGDLVPRLLLLAALGSVLVSLLVLRLPAWCAAPASMLGLAGLIAYAVQQSARTGQVSGSVVELTRDALRNGIPRVLTAMIPIEPQPDTVLVPVLATWLAGLAAAELGLRQRRVLLSYAGPAALLGGALYLVGPNAHPTLWLPLAFAGLATIGLAASARRVEPDADGVAASPGGAPIPGTRPPDPSVRAGPALSRSQRTVLRVRLVAGAAGALAIIILLATALGPSVAGRVDGSPTDPRRYLSPPQLDALDENPLVRLSGWALNPEQHLFDATVSGAPSVRIRLAVLADYDGVTWRVGATYRNAGRVLTGPPALAAQGTATEEVEQQITVDELDGRLLPGAERPERIDGVRIAYDEETGTMALPEGLRPGVSYTVVSQQPQLEVNLLPTAEVPSGDSVARYLALPGKVPDGIGALAQQLGAGVSAPYQRALAIEQFLAEHYALVTDAPSGHAYPNLNFFLFGPRNAGGQRGTSEQFAAAFAVLARALGLPTRLAVGFQAREGTNAIRGADAVAWPEVLFDGLGWVDFNPLPQPNTQPRPVEDDFRPKPEPSAPPPTAVPAPSVSAPPRPAPSQPASPGRPDAGPPVRVIALAGAGALAAGLLVALVAIPALRRRQRRERLDRGDPAARIAGAWLEVLDALRLAGRPAPEQWTATEVAGHAPVAATGGVHTPQRPNRPPPPPIDELARLANASAFAGPGFDARPPGPGEPEAARARAQAIAFAAELRARQPWWRRLLWTFDPRPLRWARLARKQPNPRSGSG